MTREEKQVIEHPQSPIRKALKEHGLIILYILQFLLVMMYMEAEIQPFVYVRF
jgi:hypothetical protein